MKPSTSHVITVAALFVEKNGAYFGVPGVDPWDESRDARGYSGPYPVVAHPPCSAWGRMAPVNKARYGHEIGDDDGCFVSALDSVEKWGGVLEHPEDSLAWRVFKIAIPHKSGGWVRGVRSGAARRSTSSPAGLYRAPIHPTCAGSRF